jgi:nucleoid-associated protein YgaU
MIARLRRILVTLLLGVLVGLGVLVTALLGRQPRKRIAFDADPPAPARSPVPRARRRRRGLAVAALASLLLLLGLAGLLRRHFDALGDLRSHSLAGSGTPLAALSPPGAGRDRAPAPVADAPEAGLPADAPAAAPAPEDRRAVLPVPPRAPTVPAPTTPTPIAPSFDVVRVEPNGETVVAGRATPNASVEVLVDGRPVAQAQADAEGNFTLTPPPLATGSSEIGLRATDALGEARRSSARVAVLIAPSRDARPLVALTSPGKPTMVLSQPEGPVASRPAPAGEPGRQALRDERSPAPARDAGASGGERSGSETGGSAPGVEAGAANRADGGVSSSAPADTAPASRRADAPAAAVATPPKVVSIDAGNGGSLFVTAKGGAGASVRLYLNETLIAPATIGRDGIVTFTIGQGVKPGSYKVRLDLVDPATGKVRDRAEVPFTAPDPGRDDGVEDPAARQDTARDVARGTDVARGMPGPTKPGTAERRTRDDAGGDAVAAGRERAEPSSPPQPSSTGSVNTGSLSANVPPRSGTNSSQVYVPEIETVRIARGDSLWRISRRTYGEGERYTLIYDANQDQIRDPDLIYPGQVLVLPNQDARDADREGMRE